MKGLELKVPPPLVLAAVLLLMWALNFAAPPLPVPFEIRVGVAATLAVLGAILGSSGFRAFARAKTTFEPTKPHEATTLVTTGIYGLTRNPMYLGMLVLSLGWEAFLSNWVSLIGPPLFVLYITWFQILPEERVLTELFGQPYRDYRAKVRRWL